MISRNTPPPRVALFGGGVFIVSNRDIQRRNLPSAEPSLINSSLPKRIEGPRVCSHSNPKASASTKGVPMLRLRLLLFATPLLLAAQPVVAKNFAVGTCKPKLPNFATISIAVSSVPPGSKIFVCPGTYAEQVVISQPLTLEGIASS